MGTGEACVSIAKCVSSIYIYTAGETLPCDRLDLDGSFLNRRRPGSVGGRTRQRKGGGRRAHARASEREGNYDRDVRELKILPRTHTLVLHIFLAPIKSCISSVPSSHEPELRECYGVAVDARI